MFIVTLKRPTIRCGKRSENFIRVSSVSSCESGMRCIAMQIQNKSLNNEESKSICNKYLNLSSLMYTFMYANDFALKFSLAVGGLTTGVSILLLLYACFHVFTWQFNGRRNVIMHVVYSLLPLSSIAFKHF